MKKKHFKPKNEQHHGFTILEISTDMVDYLLAFKLNNSLEISLSKNDDLPVYLDGDAPVFYSMYNYCKDHLTEFYLLQNLAEQNQLMTSFLFLVRGHFAESDIYDAIDRLANIDRVLNVSRINLIEGEDGKAKTKKIRKLVNTILTDLEYHMIEMKRKKTDTVVKLKPTQKGAVRKLYDA
jgi:hypothetical protein